MKILITGGLGFIGTSLALSLLEAGHAVVLVDNLSVQIHGALPEIERPDGAQVVRLDVRELAERHDVIDGCDVVYHLAAETGTAQSMYRMLDYVAINDLGTAALLAGIARCTRRPRKIVLASSRSVYGEGAYVSQSSPSRLVQPAPRGRKQLDAGVWDPIDADGTPLVAVATPESLPFAPGSVYAATKAAQELLLRSASFALGFELTVLRFQNVYGEGQSLRNPYTGIISIFFNRARQGLDIPVYEDGRESRDFVHVSDVVQALVRAIEDGLPSGAVINVGSGAPTSVHDLACQLLVAARLSVPVHISGQFRVGDIRHCYADLALARQLLGFEPRVSLLEGLTRFCAWASTQPPHADESSRATEELRRHGLTN
jgi:dTDP-L-rhamnose 4-epimerase